MNIYQFQQSPLKQSIKEALGDERLHSIVECAFGSGKVQGGRITTRSQVSGRPPSFEISAVPVKVSEAKVAAVVVLFLPPPDRPRMVQMLKQHNEKVQRLAEEWTQHGRLLLRSTVAELSDETMQTESAPEPGKESVPINP